LKKITSNAFFDAFKEHSLIMYSIPIRVALYERKMTLQGLVKLLAKNGLNYDYALLCVVVRGKANNHFNLHYFTHIYNILNLPFPSADYLFESFLRWEEIKQFKKEQLNISKIRRGLSPIP
jgi:hypothetical protein